MMLSRFSAAVTRRGGFAGLAPTRNAALPRAGVASQSAPGRAFATEKKVGKTVEKKVEQKVERKIAVNKQDGDGLNTGVIGQQTPGHWQGPGGRPDGGMHWSVWANPIGNLYYPVQVQGQAASFVLNQMWAYFLVGLAIVPVVSFPARYYMTKSRREVVPVRMKSRIDSPTPTAGTVYER
eukprot:gene239-112_t